MSKTDGKLAKKRSAKNRNWQPQRRPQCIMPFRDKVTKEH